MSQAVIDFCEGLKTTLLAVEDRIEKAKTTLSAGAAEAQDEVKRHLDEASEHLDAFKAQAAEIAANLSAELPEKAKPIREKLGEFGAEAQLALRHAVVFLAEAASKGGDAAAGALREGAHRAQKLAETLKRDTALTAPVAEPGETQASS